MQNFITINALNQRVRVNMTDEEYSNDFESITDEIESSIEDGYDCGEVFGYNWSVLKCRTVKIKDTLFNIDEDLTSSQIQSVLQETNFILADFIEIVSKDYLIEQAHIEVFTNNEPITKTILLKEDNAIYKSAYTVSLNIQDSKIEEIIKNTNELLSSISKNNIDEIKSIINKLPLDLTLDNFKLGGEFIDDWHTIFTILLKEYGLNYQITEPVLFNQ